MLYIVYTTEDPAQSKAIRATHREAHLAYLERHRDIIVLGGSRLAEDGETRLGSTFVLNVASLAEAAAFSEHEPFRCAGLYARVEIQRMRRGQWRPEVAPASVDGA